MGFKRDVDEPAHNHIQPSSQHSPAIWGRPGSAIPLYDYDYLTHADNGKLGEARVCTPHTHTLIVCCFTSHHSSVMNTLQKLSQVTKRKVLLHYSIFFCIKDLQIDSYYYTFIQLGPDLSWSLKWVYTPRTFFNPSKKKIWVNKFSGHKIEVSSATSGCFFDTFPN